MAGCEVLPIAEMDFSAIQEDRGRLCTYDSKFDPASPDYQMIQLRLPASLSVEEKRTLEKIAIAAYRATELPGLCPAGYPSARWQFSMCWM